MDRKEFGTGIPISNQLFILHELQFKFFQEKEVRNFHFVIILSTSQP